jgi:hypothetical protein
VNDVAPLAGVTVTLPTPGEPTLGVNVPGITELESVIVTEWAPSKALPELTLTVQALEAVP